MEAITSRTHDKLQAFVRFAQDLSGLSCCKRASCGAVLFPADFSGVAALGYNGPPIGQPNDACRNVQGDCGCAHAEASAIAKLVDRRQPLIMYSTTMPCETCAGLIVNCRAVRAVVWSKVYRTEQGRFIMQDAGVAVRHLDDILACDETALKRLLRAWAETR